MNARPIVFSLMLLFCVAPVAHAGRSMSKKVGSVHAPIPTQGASLKGARLAILYGMLNNKGVKWLYEGETKNSIVARWDYRGDSVLANIVYDEKEIQIQYVDASPDFTCQDLEEGVCHKNSGAYFNYMPHLRLTIAKHIRWHRADRGTENHEDAGADGDGENEEVSQGEEK